VSTAPLTDLICSGVWAVLTQTTILRRLLIKFTVESIQGSKKPGLP
jgi:hypothetical protein